MRAQKHAFVALILFFLLSQWDVGLVFGEEKKLTIGEAGKEKELTIAVADFANTGKDTTWESLVEGIPRSITTYLAKKGEVDIVERSQLQSALEEMKLQMSDLVDSQTAVRLGNLIGANAVLMGDFFQIEDMIRINSLLINIETGKVIAANQVQGAPGKQIFKLMDQTAEAMWRKLTGRAPQEEDSVWIQQTGAPQEEAPAWIQQTGIMGDVILGVGTAPKMYNPALQRREAAHQARVEIARILSTKVQAMQESFSEEARDLMTDAGQSEFLSTSVSREVADAILVGVQVTQYYTDPESGIMYAQAVLSRGDAISGILENMKKMSDKQRWIIEQHKEQAMERMDKSIENAFGE